MRKAFAFRLSMLTVIVGVCSFSALGSPTFSVANTVRDVVIDTTKSVVVQTGVMPIPEPTSLVLLGTGVAAILGKRIKRRFHK